MNADAFDGFVDSLKSLCRVDLHQGRHDSAIENAAHHIYHSGMS